MSNSTTFIGLDVHKKNIFVALKINKRKEYVEFEVPHTDKGIKKLIKKVRKESKGLLLSCYEAGVCGFGLQRRLKGEGLDCKVIAPSLIPAKPGERIKTDRRDSRKLADLLEADLLTEVHPPTEEEEALRDLCRCRAAAVKDLLRCRHRVSKMLLRRGMIWEGKSNWTLAHKKWLASLKFGQPALQITFDSYMLAMEQAEERIKSIEIQLVQISQQEPYKEPVGWLRCFRGIDTVTAMTILTELYDFRRFPNPSALMAYLGLVPSEHSSSDKVRRGSITKTGNQYVRRILIETAHHYRRKPAVGKALSKRREGQPVKIIAIADKAQQRLYQRFCHLTIGKGKPYNKTMTALARELVGFIWAVLYPNFSREPVNQS